MARSAFIGRKEELQLLDKLWKSPRASLLFLYGRRRVGKTRLLTHWLKQHDADALYWMAEPTSALDQLRSFSQALINFADPETPASVDFTYDSWEHALRQVALLTRERRIAVLIDEVTYIMDVNPDIVGALQKAWDHWLSDANLLLALCGSQMGLMQRNLINYDAPLYGRATAQLKLPPLPYGITHEFFPEYTPEERVKIYSIWGGIPAYWERLDAEITPFENLREQLVPSNTWILDEPRLLLQDFINDPYNYVGILRAIADGKQSNSEIADRIGLSGGPTSMYISILRDTGFVERRIPVTKRGTDSRQGHYFLTDPYLRFYYRFLAPFQTKLALGRQQQALKQIEAELPAFIAKNTWLELCYEWVIQASDQGQLPLPVEAVGGEWKRSFQIDVVGIDEREFSLVMGSCYWHDRPGIEAIIDNLVSHTPTVIPTNGDWSVYYLAFSAKPWTEAEKQIAEEIVLSLGSSGRKKAWEPIGIRLVSLDEVDVDLVGWAAQLQVYA